MLKKILLTIVVLLVLGLVGLGALIYLYEEDPDAPKYVESQKIPLVIPGDVKLTEVKPVSKPLPPVAKKPAPASKPTPKATPTAKKPVEKATAPAPSPVRQAKKAKTEAAPTGGNWVVNVASFTDNASAKSLSTKLTKGGYLSYTTEFMKDGTQWYRVRVGFFTSKDRAKNTADQIKSKYKHTGWITTATSAEKQKYLK